MSVRRDDVEPESSDREPQQLLNTRALVIITVAVAAGIAVAKDPSLAAPIGVVTAVVMALAVIVR